MGSKSQNDLRDLSTFTGTVDQGDSKTRFNIKLMKLMCLSISCGGMGQQQTATGTGALGAADVGMAYTLLEEVIINPTIDCQNLHRTGATSSWRAQTKAYVHQDPGERSSDLTRD